MTTSTSKTTKKAPAKKAPAKKAAAPEKLCAFCGEGKTPKNEPVLIAALYIAAMAVEPPFDSDSAHLSCARLHREQHDESLRAVRPRRAARVPVAPAVPIVWTSDNTPDAAPDAQLFSVHIGATAAEALRLTEPDAWWGVLDVATSGTKRTRTTVTGTAAALRAVGDEAARMSTGAKGGWTHEHADPSIVSRACRIASEAIASTLANTDDTVPVIRF